MKFRTKFFNKRKKLNRIAKFEIIRGRKLKVFLLFDEYKWVIDHRKWEIAHEV
jgi:hypothetical protein